jgi:tRNA threonylcarbamoyladenosine biosynthesis protein TsaB
MSNILLIETATKVCSAGIVSEKGILAKRVDLSMQYSHSSQLTTFIEEVVREAGIGFTDLDAVAVSKGPGSYTGLRIGVSAAKGLCYALDIPLLSVNSLLVMAAAAQKTIPEKPDYYIPLIDARRMEVYNAVFNASLHSVRSTLAEIIDNDSFNEFLVAGKVAFFGDGAEKCEPVIMHPHAVFYPGIHPSIEGMADIALEMFHKKEYEDVAYFEPYYLKDFVAGKPRVKGLD